MAELKFNNIEKKYPNGFHAVKKLNLDINDKEFIVLVGPSGCGKSTTLRMIAGLEDISSGELYIDDKLVNDIPPKDRDIAMVFQNYALYPHMSVYENMGFGLKLRKRPKEEIKERVEKAAKILGIEELLDRKPKELSGGQRQRVALGRAIVRYPKVFLMDEPLSNLDAKLRVQMRTEISKLHQKLQTTFVYVTHDQTEAMTMGTRIIVMKDGIVQQVADPKTIYDKPNNMFVASFIGSPQMNFIDCKLLKDNDNYYIELYDKKILISKEKDNVLKNIDFLDKEIIMGIRPENIYVTTEEDTDFNAKVEVIEMLGSETYLYLNMYGNNIISRVESNIITEVGKTIRISFEKDKIHLFDKKSGKTIF